jgi:hypothetical protein
MMVVMAEPDAAPEPDSGPKPPASPPPATKRAGGGPVLPSRSSDETDVGWGEAPEPDDEDRLRQDRPPHWDSA